MKKPAIFILAAAAILAAILALNSCGGNKCPECNSDPCSCPDPEIVVTEAISEQAPRVNVVVDKSESMKGYFNRANMLPILTTVTSLQNSGKKPGDVRLFGNAPMGNHTDGLCNAKNFSVDTDLKAIIETLTKEADSIPVAFITDGIISTPNGINDVPMMMDKIENILKEKNKLGYSIYHMETPFDGIYYIESSRGTGNYKKINISSEKRPYYVILIGPKKYLRYFNDNNPLKDYTSISFNVHDNEISLPMYPIADKLVFSGPSKQTGEYFMIDNGKDEYQLAFKFPACIKNSVEKLSASNANLKINGNEYKKWKLGLQGDGENVAILTIDNKNGDFDTECKDKNTLELSFDTSGNKEWESYFSENDSNIATDINEQAKTFGLKYLIEAFRETQDNEEVKVSFKFTNE